MPVQTQNRVKKATTRKKTTTEDERVADLAREQRNSAVLSVELPTPRVDLLHMSRSDRRHRGKYSSSLLTCENVVPLVPLLECARTRARTYLLGRFAKTLTHRAPADKIKAESKPKAKSRFSRTSRCKGARRAAAPTSGVSQVGVSLQKQGSKRKKK